MKTKDFITLGIVTLITVVFWMIFEVVHTANKSTITPILQEQIKPLTPTFDTKVLKRLKERSPS